MMCKGDGENISDFRFDDASANDSKHALVPAHNHKHHNRSDSVLAVVIIILVSGPFRRSSRLQGGDLAVSLLLIFFQENRVEYEYFCFFFLILHP